MGAVKDTLFDVIGETRHETRRNLWHVDIELARLFGRLAYHATRISETRRELIESIENDDTDNDGLPTWILSRRLDHRRVRFDETEHAFRALWVRSAIPTDLLDDALAQAKNGKGVRTDRAILNDIATALSVEQWSADTLDEIAQLVLESGRDFNNNDSHTQGEQQ